MTNGASMKALALEGFDAPPKVIDVPIPEPGVGELLVRMRAASVNAYDTFVAAGMMKDYLPHEFPAVLGQDLGGVVAQVGEGVEGFVRGDRVFGTIGVKGAVHDGTFGELATPQAASVAPTPGNVNDEQAGTLGVAATTAMSAVEAIHPADGVTVLVVGATGGVGMFAVQLAAGRGAHVIASVRPGDEGFVTGLGAAETVDYTGDLAAAVRDRHPDGVDALIDLVNRDPAGFAALVALVHDGGRAASALGGAGEATEIGGAAVANIGSNPDHLAPLGALVADGKLRAEIQRTYRLAEAEQAMSDFTTGHTVGKLVITMP